MRAAVLLLSLGACAFPASGGQPGTGSPPGTDAGDVDAPDARPGEPDAVPPPPDARDCPTGYVGVAGTPSTSKYRAVRGNSGLNGGYVAAIATCALDEAHLVIPDAAGEGAAIWALASTTLNNPSPYVRVGVSRLNEASPWRDVAGDVFTVPLWGEDQPNSGSGRLCLLVDQAGAYWDYDCGSGDDFVCECD